MNHLNIKSLTPRIAKRYLLFIAAFMWTFASGMLLFKGITFGLDFQRFLILKTCIGIIGGIAFYVLLFSKISLKYILRIINLNESKPCIFSFFSFKSYFMMFIMISIGILFRKSGIISLEYFSVFYIVMGIPLFFSAIKFYYYAIYYKSIINNMHNITS
ncbi:MAG: hypothetical protein WCK02_05955 [Bacteroidota bacterium]